MPKFDFTDDIFQGFDAESFTSQLPDESTLTAAGLDPRASSFVRDLTRSQWDNFALATRIEIMAEATIRGIPSFRAGAQGGQIASMFRSAREVMTGDVESAVAPVLEGLRAAVGGKLLTFDEALAAIGTRVPVVGPFVGLAVSLYRAIRDAIAGAEGKPQVVEALSYSKGADSDFAGDLLRKMTEDDDWTSIFLPVRPADDGFESQAVQAGGATGRVFRSRLFGDGMQGMGILPELADVDPFKGAKYGETPQNTVGAVGTWQYLKVTNRDPGPEALRGYAAFYPSATQLGAYAWQRVMEISPAMFRVNMSAVRTAWLEYFDALIAWAKSQDDVLRRLALYAASWGDPRTFGSGAGAMRRADGGNKFHRTWNVSEYPSYVSEWPGSLGELVDWAVERSWGQQVRPALRTLVCAYVPPTAAAFTGDPSLGEYHDEMRRKLLEHPARFDVELDLIPDDEYRQEMYQRTLVVGTDIKAKGSMNVETYDGAPVVEPGEAPPEYCGPTGQGAEPGGGGGVVVAILAAALAGLAAL